MNRRKSGVLLHPTSFPSPYGIGDLGKSPLEFIDFLKSAKQSLWQILPLGHTCFGDSPYQSFSAFAGNPLLISLDKLSEDGLLTEDDLKNPPKFSPFKVEYGKVIDYKYPLYRKAFENFLNLKDRKTTLAFNSFCRKNADWLDDYCLFVSLKDYFIKERANTINTPEYKAYKKASKKTMSEDSINDCFYGASWDSWPEDIRDRKESVLRKWHKTLKSDVDFYKFLQYKFNEQWLAVKKYANENGIEIIGDIPIFAAADSADTWSHPELFEMGKTGHPTEVAGVPPDYFSETGQLWGNPLYKWDYHKKTGYEWWIKRIENTLSLVDIVRIDHFRAFESYWSIPYGSKNAVKGKWKKGPGEDIFDAVKKALKDIPIIAEDLGDLNEEVLILRDKLGFPGMKILQFAFDSDEKNTYLPHNYTDTNCIVYTGTHDNDTTIGWYTKADSKTKDHVRRMLNISGADIAWDLIRFAYSTTANIVIIPLQDILCLDSFARMNTPGVSGGNWQFRYEEGSLTYEKSTGLSYLASLYNR